MADNPITGKLVLNGRIEAVSALHIGSGQADNSDMDILRNQAGEPYIPATSFVGVLRHFFDTASPGFNRFWGTMNGSDDQQSSLVCADLVPENSTVVVRRDGVRLNNNTGLAKDTGKFDYEILEPGTCFSLCLEVTLRRDRQESFRFFCSIYDLLDQDRIRLGAKTGNGLGRIRLLTEQTKIFLFDFKQYDHVRAWLKQDFSATNQIDRETLGSGFDLKKKICRIRANMVLKSSLLVRSYGHTPEAPDTVQLQSGKNWLIPGTSIKGAVRARAERIVNTLELADKNRFMDNLFGYVREKGTKKEGASQGSDRKKSRVQVEDVVLDRKKFTAELQSRIRIDRFTGGVINGALFDSMPVFAPEQEQTVTFNFAIREYSEAEIGLFLLILKDLWTGDLPIGGEKNIGRGVFQGKEAEIIWDGGRVIFRDPAKIDPDDLDKLNGFVETLVALKNGGS
jgi:CRISPR/Cas system CSM-associated protein Csm3 (group 7 of RAMP superfamily)